MPTKFPTEFPREIMQLFDKYVHGDIDRRGFLDGAGKFAVGGVSAAAYLSALTPDFANAQQIRPNDPRLWVESIRIPSPEGSGTINAYLARPRGMHFWRKLPVIIVVHENRGLNPHIRDITRRIALEGYIAIAPDALTALGGYPGDEDTARTKFATLDQNKIKQDFIAATKFARVTEHANNQLGAIGFCYGGGMVNYLATQCDYLHAAVPFYGAAAPLDGVANIRAKLLLHFASDDERFNAMWPPYEAALRTAHKSYQAFTYEGTMHGFNNDTTPRYNATAAALAWQRTISFFDNELKHR
jgi:carboxymethylenebutenolidase